MLSSSSTRRGFDETTLSGPSLLSESNPWKDEKCGVSWTNGGRLEDRGVTGRIRIRWKNEVELGREGVD